MGKMLTEDGKIHAFLCARPGHDPPLPICEKQCKACFDMDAEMEYRVRQRGFPPPAKEH